MRVYTSIHTNNLFKYTHLYTHTHAQTANSDPANLMWEKDKTYLTCVSPGLYEIQVSSWQDSFDSSGKRQTLPHLCLVRALRDSSEFVTEFVTFISSSSELDVEKDKNLLTCVSPGPYEIQVSSWQGSWYSNDSPRKRQTYLTCVLAWVLQDSGEFVPGFVTLQWLI